jgi:hypothetical protein
MEKKSVLRIQALSSQHLDLQELGYETTQLHDLKQGLAATQWAGVDHRPHRLWQDHYPLQLFALFECYTNQYLHSGRPL